MLLLGSVQGCQQCFLEPAPPHAHMDQIVLDDGMRISVVSQAAADTTTTEQPGADKIGTPAAAPIGRKDVESSGVN